MLEAVGFTDSGCIRANNEDFFLVEPELGLYIVADGMGGAQAGEQASRMAALFVLEKLRSVTVRDLVALTQSIQEANLAVMDAAARAAELQGMGTTIVAALESPVEQVNGSQGTTEVSIASVGDSRAYLYQDGAIHELTQDQTWVNEVGRRLGMDEETLRSHPMRHVLTMAVGVSQPLRVNTHTVRLALGMQILLCSDGLHGVVPLETIGKILGTASWTLEGKGQRLIEAAREAGGPDNITAILLRAIPKNV